MSQIAQSDVDRVWQQTESVVIALLDEILKQIPASSTTGARVGLDGLTVAFEKVITTVLFIHESMTKKAKL